MSTTDSRLVLQMRLLFGTVYLCAVLREKQLRENIVRLLLLLLTVEFRQYVL